MAIAQLANLIGGGGLNYQGAYQNAQGQWVQDVTSNEGVTTQQSLQDQLTPDQWTQFQNELQQGLISPNASNMNQQGLTVNTNLLPKILGQYNVNPVAQNMGGGFTTLGSDSSVAPMLGRGVLNPAGIKWDPNYGWVTTASNLKSDDDLFNKIGATIGDIAPTAIMAAMAGGFAGLAPLAAGGAPGAGLFSKIPGLINTISSFGNQAPQTTQESSSPVQGPLMQLLSNLARMG